MKSMVVLFALCAVAYGSYLPLAQPPHFPALILDPRGRPLDTAEVINSRALHLQAKALEGHYGYGAPWIHSGLGYAGHHLYKRSLGHHVHAAPAVSHQSRVDVISSPPVHVAPVVAHHAAPVVAHHAAPVVAHHAAPIVSYHTPSAAVSHQSRVDIVDSPAVVPHAAVAPVVAHDVALAPAVIPVGHHGHHGGLVHINHAALAPVGYAAGYGTPLAW